MKGERERALILDCGFRISECGLRGPTRCGGWGGRGAVKIIKIIKFLPLTLIMLNCVGVLIRLQSLTGRSVGVSGGGAGVGNVGWKAEGRMQNAEGRQGAECELALGLITLKNFPHGADRNTDAAAGRVAKVQWHKVARWGTPRMGRAVRMS